MRDAYYLVEAMIEGVSSIHRMFDVELAAVCYGGGQLHKSLCGRKGLPSP